MSDGDKARILAAQDGEMIRIDREVPCGWTKLFHKSGALVTIPVTAAPLDYAAMAANVDAMIAAGFAVTMPGLEEGELKEMVAWVVRRTVPSRSGSCPRVYLYVDNEAFTRAHVAHYLNTPEDIAAFEFASGMKLEQIPVWPADAAPERGKSGDGFIVKAKKPFGMIFKINPEYKEGDKDKTKRLFVRWADTPASSSPPKDGDCITEKEASLMAEIIMKLRTPPMQIGAFLHWLGAWPKGTPATLDDLVKIPKAKYAQGYQHLQKLEQDFDRKGAGV